MEKSDLLYKSKDILDSAVYNDWKGLKQALVDHNNDQTGGHCEWLLPLMNQPYCKSAWNKLPNDEIESFKKSCCAIEDVFFPTLLLMYNRFRFLFHKHNSNDNVVVRVMKVLELYNICDFEDPEKNILKHKILEELDGANVEDLNPSYFTDPYLYSWIKNQVAMNDLNSYTSNVTNTGKIVKSLVLVTNDGCSTAKNLCHTDQENTDTNGSTVFFKQSQDKDETKSHFETKLLETARSEISYLDNKESQNDANPFDVNATSDLNLETRKGSCELENSDIVLGTEEPDIKLPSHQYMSHNHVQFSTSKLVNPIAQRPKRNIRIPNRLKSDENTLKVLKFSDRTRISEKVFFSSKKSKVSDSSTDMAKLSVTDNHKFDTAQTLPDVNNFNFSQKIDSQSSELLYIKESRKGKLLILQQKSLQTDGNNLPCSEISGISFVDNTLLENNSVTFKKKFSCDLCNLKMDTVMGLKDHMNTHRCVSTTKGNVKKNSNCYHRKESTNDSFLKGHAINNISKSPYTCEICGATFKWKAAINRHAQTHTNVKPYKCDRCGKSFADKPYLKRHKMIHSGERPFKCEICFHTFVTEYDLKQHLKGHSNDKKYVCEVCGAAFVRSCYLYKHKRIHYGKKHHACDQCDRKFYEAHRLRDHLKRHEKAAIRLKKSFICECCGRVFAKKIYLIKHVMTHTGNKPYVCSRCPAKFVDSFKLKQHIKTHDKGTSRKGLSISNNPKHLSLQPQQKSVYSAEEYSVPDNIKDGMLSGHECLEIHIDGVEEEQNGDLIRIIVDQMAFHNNSSGTSETETKYILESATPQDTKHIIVNEDQLSEHTGTSNDYKLIIVEVP